MTTNPQKPKPEYSQELLIRLVKQTKNETDMVQLTVLYIELEEIGDITITSKLALAMYNRQHQFRSGNNPGKNRNNN